MWNPWLPGVSPATFASTRTLSPFCENVTVPARGVARGRRELARPPRLATAPSSRILRRARHGDDPLPVVRSWSLLERTARRGSRDARPPMIPTRRRAIASCVNCAPWLTIAARRIDPAVSASLGDGDAVPARDQTTRPTGGPMNRSTDCRSALALAAVVAAAARRLHAATLRTRSNVKPAFVGVVTKTTYDGISDDLLTAGLGKTGLGGAAPPRRRSDRAHGRGAAPARDLQQLPRARRRRRPTAATARSTARTSTSTATRRRARARSPAPSTSPTPTTAPAARTSR